jgi:hypothetical protein
VELPKEVMKIVKEYEKCGGARSIFLWKWCTCLRDSGLIFSNVPKEQLSSVANTRTIFTLFVSLFDDVADVYKNERLLNEMLKFPFLEYINLSNLNNKEEQYLKFTMKVWNFILEKLKKYPKYKELRKIYFYDLQQMLNSIYYSFCINKNLELINLREAETYGPFNMAFFLYSDIDLMASLNFDKKEFSLIREVVWYAQKMARIGNWLSTWEREINEDDYTSGVFAYAISKNIITPEELRSRNKEKIIRKVKTSDFFEYFLKKWETYYLKIYELSPKIKSININNYLEGLEKLLEFHLISKGFK